jgi:hypothetical protein
VLSAKLKKVPDLRSQEQIHPRAAKWRERIEFWNPFFSFSTNTGPWIYATFRKR